MRRREFISLLGGAAVTWPSIGDAQQAKMPVIGYLSGATSEMMHAYVAAFHRGLAETGYDGNDRGYRLPRLAPAVRPPQLAASSGLVGC